MKTPLAFWLGLAFCATFDAPAAELPKAPATESSILTGNDTNVVLLYGGGYKYEVSKAKLETLPDWNVASNTIPLQPQQAAQIALARFSSLHPAITNVDTRNISMRRLSCGGSKWAYYVQVDYTQTLRPVAETQDSSKLEPPHMVIVFFDGTVVDPVIDPDAGRRPRPKLPEPRRSP
jgi:hypothetical protein